MSARLTLFAESVARIATDVRDLVVAQDLEILAIEMFAVRQPEAEIVARMALGKLKPAVLQPTSTEPGGLRPGGTKYK